MCAKLNNPKNLFDIVVFEIKSIFRKRSAISSSYKKNRKNRKIVDCLLS